MIPQRFRLPLRNDLFRVLVQHDHPVGDRLDTREFVRHDDERDLEVPGEAHNQLIQFGRRDGIESRRGLIRKRIRGSSAMARAIAARFLIPPLISSGSL